jgi:hypothetical protein
MITDHLYMSKVPAGRLCDKIDGLCLTLRMRLVIILFAIAGSVAASPLDILPQPPENSYLTDHPWIPAALIANSSRSPCPMLNTLANHGFLNRNGTSITKTDFNRAQVDVLNMTPGFANKTTNAMVAKLGSPKNTSSSFSLSDFAAHDFTEHDASLTRLDQLQGNVIDVQPSLVLLLIEDSSSGWLNALSIGRSRARREAESRAIGSPPLSSAFTSFAQLESSFIPLVFGVGEVASMRSAPAEQVKVWLHEERFPSELGYMRSQEPLTADLQSSLIAEIKMARDSFVGQYQT